MKDTTGTLNLCSIIDVILIQVKRKGIYNCIIRLKLVKITSFL